MSTCTAVRSLLSTENVCLFVPNLIGYVRAVLAVLAFASMQHWPLLTATCYLGSGLLDAVDGLAARHLDQSSRYGAMLDQLLDRCCTMCLTACLCVFYPAALLPLQLSMAIDISCHWIHLHVTAVAGAASHKQVDGGDVPALLKLYYTSRPLLFVMCGGNELFYCSLYLLHFGEGPMLLGVCGLYRALVALTLPIAVLKSALALMQGYCAWRKLALIDQQERRAIKHE